MVPFCVNFLEITSGLCFHFAFHLNLLQSQSSKMKQNVEEAYKKFVVAKSSLSLVGQPRPPHTWMRCLTWRKDFRTVAEGRPLRGMGTGRNGGRGASLAKVLHVLQEAEPLGGPFHGHGGRRVLHLQRHRDHLRRKSNPGGYAFRGENWTHTNKNRLPVADI